MKYLHLFTDVFHDHSFFSVERKTVVVDGTSVHGQQSGIHEKLLIKVTAICNFYETQLSNFEVVDRVIFV